MLPSHPVLIANNLRKVFGPLVAVDNVSFELGRGEILGLLGPNGAGKTTTFQMLLGVLNPTAGEVSYFGEDFHRNRSAILERINFSTTYSNLPWNLRVSDALAFISRLYSYPPDATTGRSVRQARVDEMIERFRLRSLLKKDIVKLSAGELTRLNLAKAFINNPEIVLLDEPTASLDPESALLIRNFVKEQRDERGLSVLFTSHNMTEVESVCDRVIFINSGKVVANDTPANLARSLDRCTIAFTFDGADQVSLKTALTSLGHSFEITEHEASVKVRDSDISTTIREVSNASTSLRNITISRGTLEEYFIAQTNLVEGK